MPLRSRDGHLFIVDDNTDAEWRANRRARIAAWCVVLIVGVAFWAVLIGLLL